MLPTITCSDNLIPLPCPELHHRALVTQSSTDPKEMADKQDQDVIEVVAIEQEAAPRDRVCFYGGAHYLSNMYITEFTDGDTIYNCVEQYFQAAKAALFKDTATQSLIMGTKAPTKQKQLGKKVKPFDKAEWAEGTLAA